MGDGSFAPNRPRSVNTHRTATIRPKAPPVGVARRRVYDCFTAPMANARHRPARDMRQRKIVRRERRVTDSQPAARFCSQSVQSSAGAAVRDTTVERPVQECKLPFISKDLDLSRATRRPVGGKRTNTGPLTGHHQSPISRAFAAASPRIGAQISIRSKAIVVFEVN